MGFRPLIASGNLSKQLTDPAFTTWSSTDSICSESDDNCYDADAGAARQDFAQDLPYVGTLFPNEDPHLDPVLTIEVRGTSSGHKWVACLSHGSKIDPRDGSIRRSERSSDGTSVEKSHRIAFQSWWC